MDELLERAVASGAVPGIAAVVTGRDGVIYEGTAGRLGTENDAPVAPDTMFRLMSMTKALTSVAVMQLV
jgi:CubicO group peptidase (beta-lactamase class C family)